MINIERSHFQGEWWENFQLLSTLWVCEDKDAYDLSHKWMRKYGRVCYLQNS